MWTFLVCVNIFRFAQKNSCLQKSCLLLLCFGTKIQDYNEVPLKIWVLWSIMSEWSWNSPEWQFASFLFALPSQWSRKAVHSTVNLVQPTAAQPCWFIGAIHWEMLHFSGSGSAHQFHVDFYSCPWMVKGFGYHNQIFALLSSVWCCTPSAVLARVWGCRGNMSRVLIGVLNHVPLYLHVCSACFVWEVGHRMTIKRCEEVASNVLIPLWSLVTLRCHVHHK